ncbi:hypothetical protein C5167_041925 [Papaver somniferum]|nr:hypothetical protein C5167_041925 [Papaver somniferum]
MKPYNQIGCELEHEFVTELPKEIFKRPKLKNHSLGLRRSGAVKSSNHVPSSEKTGIPISTKDLKDPEWSVVIQSPRKIARLADDLLKPEFGEFQSIFQDESLLYNMSISSRDTSSHQLEDKQLVVISQGSCSTKNWKASGGILSTYFYTYSSVTIVHGFQKLWIKQVAELNDMKSGKLCEYAFVCTPKLFIEEFSSGASAGLGCSCSIAFYPGILLDHIDSTGLS